MRRCCWRGSFEATALTVGWEAPFERRGREGFAENAKNIRVFPAAFAGPLRSFVPAQSTRKFTLLIMDVGELILMPRLIAHLNEVAPGLRIVCRQTDRNRYATELATGAADLAFGEVPSGQPDLVQQFLFDEHMVCVVSRNHTAIRRSLSRAQFLAIPQVANAEHLWEARLKSAMGADFQRRRIAMELRHFLVMPLVDERARPGGMKAARPPLACGLSTRGCLPFRAIRARPLAGTMAA